MRPHFRFEDLEIWQRSRDLAVKLHKLADKLDQKKLFRYAEQLRAAGLSLTNNIAEGSGSTHSKEFMQFLNIARNLCSKTRRCCWFSRRWDCLTPRLSTSF
ncbi:MAG TPA: four helix bundle protein [Blastocatellia bacterium]|nr:four helix bundle protein [Blastocatellia bacterium]